MTPRPILAVAVLALLAGCGKSERASEVVVGNQVAAPAIDDGTSETPVANETEAAPKPAAQRFVDAIAASDAFEIASAKLALDKSKTPRIRSFAEQMVRDHSESTRELKAIIAGLSPPLTPNAAPPAAQEADLGVLKELPAPAFDEAYLTQQSTAHENALMTLDAYAEHGDIAALRDFAAKTGKVVRGHIDMLRKIDRGIEQGG